MSTFNLFIVLIVIASSFQAEANQTRTIIANDAQLLI